MRNVIGPVALAGLLLPGLAHATGFKVSSYQKDSRNPGIYDAASALDGDPATAWKVDPEAENMAGQFIEVGIPASSVDKIGLMAGWEKDESTFKDYARIKKARVEVFQGDTKVGSAEIDVKDQMGWQILDVPDMKVEGAGGRVRITIEEVYSGQDFPNLAVSDVRIQLAEFPAGSIKVVEPASGTEALVDKNPKTVWTGGLDTTFGLTASGYGLASLGIQAGPPTGGRPKTIEVTANDNTQKVTLEDKQEMQWVMLPVLVGYTGSSWGRISVKVVDTYPGTAVGGAAVGIAELALNGATIEEF